MLTLNFTLTSTLRNTSIKYIVTLHINVLLCGQTTQKVLNFQRRLKDVLVRSSSQFQLCRIQQKSLEAHFLRLVCNLVESTATVDGKRTVIRRESDVFSIDFDRRFPRRPEDSILVSVAQQLHNHRTRPACVVRRADAMSSHYFRFYADQ